MAFKDLKALLEEEQAPRSGVDRRRPRVVVVDDDEAVRKGLQALLREHYDVELYATAQEGVDAVDEEVSAVVLDVRMKGNDGFWACNEIRKHYPDMPVIFYSAYQNLKDPFDIINEHYPFGYLPKDGDRSRILRAVDSAVRLRDISRKGREIVRKLRREAAAAKGGGR